MADVRLIDANALLERIDKEREYLLGRGQTGAEHILVHNFRDLVEEAPTIERPKGIWQLEGMIWYCFNCGHYCEQGGNNYCGQCGAEMGEGELD